MGKYSRLLAANPNEWCAKTNFLEAHFWPVVDLYQLQDFQRLVCLTIAVRNAQNPANWLGAVAQLRTHNR